ncbi:MAG: hypothetical protein RR084_01745, partial [Bacteroidales bacterium]
SNKKFFIILVFIFFRDSLFVAPKMDKEKCSTILDNGETFPLYGTVNIVENFEVICVNQHSYIDHHF